jgi:hypothetical protein
MKVIMPIDAESLGDGGVESDHVEDRNIDAHPTKEFFIYMLTKDIGLIRAILDLVDNCIDGARRLREDGNFSNLYVNVNITTESISIEDNCGGIDIETARKYAFRFGRPPDMPATAHSVGQFGVGMKRSIFKLGKKSHIKSMSSDGSFEVDIDVDNWLIDPNNWNFSFSRLSQHGQQTSGPFRPQGTSIKVYSLHESVSKDFSLENFHSRLKSEVEKAHQRSIECGLAIRLNGIVLRSTPNELLQSGELQSVHKRLLFKPQAAQVSVDIYCGISEGNPSSAGWTIFCNNRMVLNADQTEITGWGEGQGTTIPRYHNTFARFRGFVHFDSEETSYLPWNTTKTGVDVDSDIYQRVRLEMITIMRPVLDFLGQLARERTEQSADPGPLEASISGAQRTRIEDIEQASVFVAPKYIPKADPDTGRIQYSKPLKEIITVQSKLGLSTYKDVGEKTFEYFLQMECD